MMLDFTPIETWIMHPDQLQAAFDRSGPGDIIVYSVGDLGHERQTTRGWSKEWTDLSADLAYGLSESGCASLAQKKLAPNKYEYWLVKR